MKYILLIIACLFSVQSIATEQQQTVQQNTNTQSQQNTVIAYYNADWQRVAATDKVFYYRKLLASDETKGYLVQDFYANNHKKQTDPIWVKDKAAIYDSNLVIDNGDIILWHFNGNKRAQSHFQQGQIQSLTRWYRNGRKEFEGNYQNGLKHGQWIHWHPNGNKHWQGNYNNGLEEGIWQFWYRSGELNAEGAFTNGKRQGLWTIWLRTGQKEREMQFEQGEKVAQWNKFAEQ